MKKEDGAKKILRALTDVDDSYIEEAADSGEKIQPVHSRRIVKFRRAVMIAAAAAACFSALLAVRMLNWRAGTAPQSSGSTEAAEEDTAAAPNPVVEVGSLGEAGALAGFDLALPDAEAPYTDAAYAVIDGTMIDVTYSDDAGEVGLNIRKAPVTEGSDDISGDYNDYAQTKKITVDGISVTLRGNNGTWSVATWTEGGFAYAVGAQEHPLSEEKMTKLIAEIK